MKTTKVTSVRGPERHDSASLRVTTAPYALLMTITPLKYFRRWGGGAPIVSSPLTRANRVSAHLQQRRWLHAIFSRDLHQDDD